MCDEMGIFFSFPQQRARRKKWKPVPALEKRRDAASTVGNIKGEALG